MKSVLPIQNAAHAAFHSVFQLHTFSDVHPVHSFNLLTLKKEKTDKNSRLDVLRSGFIPRSLALRVTRGNDHMDRAGLLRPVVSGKEASNQIESLFFTP